jgi:molybdate transport system regulatory protein
VKFRFKIWSEVGGKPLLGSGRYRLLSALQRTGSINSAAADAGISYRRAWAQIREMEQLLGYPLIVPQRGGKAGGGTILTAQALKLMEEYERLCRTVEKALSRSGAKVTE